MKTNDERFLEIQERLLEEFCQLLPLDSHDDFVAWWVVNHARNFRQICDWVDLHSRGKAI
jgi:hypothetical protein